MLNIPIQEYITHTPLERQQRKPSRFRSDLSRHLILLVCTATLLFGSVLVSRQQSSVQAANPGAGNACTWYTNMLVIHLVVLHGAIIPQYSP